MLQRIGNTTCKWVNLDPPRLLSRQERLLKREILDPRSVLSQNQHLKKMRSRRNFREASCINSGFSPLEVLAWREFGTYDLRCPRTRSMTCVPVLIALPRATDWHVGAWQSSHAVQFMVADTLTPSSHTPVRKSSVVLATSSPQCEWCEEVAPSAMISALPAMWKRSCLYCLCRIELHALPLVPLASFCD